MSAITFDVRLDAAAATDRLRVIVDRIEARRPFFEAVGMLLSDSARENFRKERAPSGLPWTPLAASTIKARKTRGKSAISILRDRGALVGSINFAATADSVSIGAVPIYSAIHQLGGVIEKPQRQGKIFRKQEKDGTIGRRFVKRKSADLETEVTIPAHQVKIPARPYLGISAADEKAILETAERWLLS